MARVYLETSFVSACVTVRTDAASEYRRAVSLEWWTTQASRHQPLVSDEVVAELSDPLFSRSADAMRLIDGLESLRVSEEVVGLAAVLVREKVMPGPVKGDAIHVALAVVHRVEYVLSWNVRHLSNPNKIRHLATVCLRVGAIPPQIMTPDMLWEMDDEPS
jgi:hypothetical protein